MTNQIPTTAAMPTQIPPGPSGSAVDHRSVHTGSQTTEPATKIPDQQIAEVFEKHASLFMPSFFPAPLTLAENDVLCPVLARLPVSAGLGPLTMTYFHLGIVPLVTRLPTRVTPEQISNLLHEPGVAPHPGFTVAAVRDQLRAIFNGQCRVFGQLEGEYDATTDRLTLRLNSLNNRLFFEHLGTLSRYPAAYRYLVPPAAPGKDSPVTPATRAAAQPVSQPESSAPETRRRTGSGRKRKLPGRNSPWQTPSSRRCRSPKN